MNTYQKNKQIFFRYEQYTSKNKGDLLFLTGGHKQGTRLVLTRPYCYYYSVIRKCSLYFIAECLVMVTSGVMSRKKQRLIKTQ
jgi:hypothetical protein